MTAKFTPSQLAEFKYPVPGDQVPSDTPVILQTVMGSFIPLLDGVPASADRALRFGEHAWTRKPIRSLLPPPTGLGAVIRDIVIRDDGRHWDHAVRVKQDSEFPWRAYGGGDVEWLWLRDEDLVTWAVVSEGVDL